MKDLIGMGMEVAMKKRDVGACPRPAFEVTVT
jgi:hypothetical protein